jgi:aryl-alcohol dehydrogenase-like predicted oxidoreductase
LSFEQENQEAAKSRFEFSSWTKYFSLLNRIFQNPPHWVKRRSEQLLVYSVLKFSLLHPRYLLGEDSDGDNCSSLGSEDCVESEEDDVYEFKLHNERDDNIALPWNGEL